MSDHYALVNAGGQATEVIGEIKIGRDNSNDIVLSDPLISRFHATVYIQGDFLMVRDEQSVNGTLVNGKKIYDPVPLNDKDQLQFGDEILVVLAPSAQSKTILSSTMPEQDTLQDSAQLENSAVEQVRDQRARDVPVKGPKKDQRTNLILVFLVLLLLCVGCISLFLVILFLARNSLGFSAPSLLSIGGLLGFLFLTG